MRIPMPIMIHSSVVVPQRSAITVVGILDEALLLLLLRIVAAAAAAAVMHRFVVGDDVGRASRLRLEILDDVMMSATSTSAFPLRGTPFCEGGRKGF